jgi:hypothetical protein
MCSSAHGFLTEAVTVSPVFQREWKFNYGSLNVILSEIYGILYNGVSLNEILIIRDEIELAVDYDTEVNHLIWKFTVNGRLGVLKLTQFKAIVDDFNITISVKQILLEQQIPDMFTTEKNCDRTGTRKYLVMGKRKEECRDITVKRSLTADEIKQVNDRLMAKLTDVKLIDSQFD